PIRFVRREAAVALAPRQGASWDVDEIDQQIERQGRIALETLQRPVGQSALQRAHQLRGVEDVEAEQDDVGMCAGSAARDESAEAADVAGERLSARGGRPCGGSHMASDYEPYGRRRQLCGQRLR